MVAWCLLMVMVVAIMMVFGDGNGGVDVVVGDSYGDGDGVHGGWQW